jgi:hypothetical protein
MTTRLLMAALACSLIACGYAPVRPPRPEQPPPDGRVPVTIVVENRLGWPMTLRDVRASIDDQSTSTGPLDNGAAFAGTVHVEPRNHGVLIRAQATVPAGKDECLLEVTLLDAVHVGWNPAEVRVSVFSRGPTVPFEDRIDLAIGFSGGQRANLPVEMGGFDERHCRALKPIPRGLCRAQAAVKDARRHRDAVRMLCYLDRQSRIEERAAAANVFEETTASLEPGSALPEAQQQQARRLREIDQLSGELDQCLSVEPVYFEKRPGPRRRASPSCAAATDPDQF